MNKHVRRDKETKNKRKLDRIRESTRRTDSKKRGASKKRRSECRVFKGEIKLLGLLERHSRSLFTNLRRIMYEHLFVFL